MMFKKKSKDRCGVCKGKRRVVATHVAQITSGGKVRSRKIREKIICPSCKGTGTRPGR